MGSDGDTPRTRALAALVLIAAYAVLVTPVILSGREGTSEASDERRYHLPVIETMVEQWPHVDVVDYRSASSPGYHLALAFVSRTLSDRIVVLRLFSTLASLGLVLVVWWGAARYTGAVPALALTLPVLASTYLLGGAIWLTTDNPALLFVCLVVAGAMSVTPTPGRLIRWGVYAVLAVAVRQIHVWVAVPLAVAAWRASPAVRFAPAAFRPSSRGSWRSSGWAVAAVAAPLLLVAWLVMRWGGLTPPAYADLHDAGINPAAVVLVLALFGVFGLFYLPATVEDGRRLLTIDRTLVAAGTAAFIVALIVPTAYDKPAGRWGGAIWTAVEMLPAVADRSIVLPPLAGLGAIVLVHLWRRCLEAGRGGAALVLAAAVVAWVVAQSMNSQAWQRYCEPFVLITLAWLSALAWTAGWSRASRMIGPAVLGLGQLALSIWRVYLPVIEWIAPT